MFKINRLVSRFCVDVDRIKCFEEVMLTILKHSGSGLLADAINDKVRSINIDDAVRKEMLSFFDPLQGV
jgi:hypothetical protein